ncbi:hypothetical protein FB446DRAFT_13305 [Lentinula raphanica]|nr:hypothetical protein FB446DRAFT_13305 [Lentinula raphanica]
MAFGLLFPLYRLLCLLIPHMDNNSAGNDGQQRSALPRSLIPHLYSAPQTSRDSSTRTTLPEQEEDDSESQEQQRSASPFALRPIPSTYPPSQTPPIASRRYPSSYPVYDHSVQPSSGPDMRLPPTVPPIRHDISYYGSRPVQGYSFDQMEIQQSYMPPSADTGWREGEAGPSNAPQRGYYHMPRYPPRIPQDYRYSDHYAHQQQQSQHRESYTRQEEQYPAFGTYSQGHPLQQHGMNTLLSPLQTHRQSSEHVYDMDPSSRPSHQGTYTFPTPGPQSGSSTGSVARGWDPPIADSSSAAVDYSSSSYPISLPPLPQTRYSTEPDDDDGEYLPPGRRNQKRKHSEQEPGSRPKKTLIACDFCRGRKLRCDGARPSCSNCETRDNQVCVYQSYPRRRGPGKAPKGQRKKKSAATTSASERSRASNEGSQQYSPSGDDLERERLAPDFRSQQHSQHLPPISIHPYTGPPQAGTILAPASTRLLQGEIGFLPQNDDQGRYQQRYSERGPGEPTDRAQPPYPDNARR